MKTFADRALDALRAPENSEALKRFQAAFNNATVDAFGEVVVPAELVTGLVAGMVVTMSVNLAKANPRDDCSETEHAAAFACEVMDAAAKLLDYRERSLATPPATVTTH